MQPFYLSRLPDKVIVSRKIRVNRSYITVNSDHISFSEQIKRFV